MHKSDAPGPISVKPRRQRKAAVVGAAGELQRQLQELGDAIDGVVHALRVGDALVEGFARRCHELWLEQEDMVLEWRPAELKAGARLVLAADTNSGRFIWPAYGAGLRALALRLRSSPGDVLNLAKQLVALERDESTAPAFTDWLWRGAALGFDVAQACPAPALGATLITRELDEAAQWAARSTRAVARWNDLSWKATQTPEAAALASQVADALARMQGRVERGELGLALADAQALQASADDAAAWARAELPLIVKRPALRDALPPSEVTLACVDLFQGSKRFDPRVVELCAALGALYASGPGLDDRRIGAAIAQSLLAQAAPASIWFELVSEAAPPLVAGLLALLVERAEQEPGARAALTAVIERVSPTELFERLELSQVKPELAAALLGAALKRGCQPAELVPVLERLPAEAVLAALGAWPVLLAHAQALLDRLVSEQPESTGSRLCELASASREGALAVGALLLARQGAGLNAKALERALGELVRAGLGARFVKPLWDARALASNLRLAALAALANDAQLLDEVLRARKGGLLEAPEIRAALEQLRWSKPR